MDENPYQPPQTQQLSDGADQPAHGDRYWFFKPFHPGTLLVLAVIFVLPLLGVLFFRFAAR